jgi:Flp pilus assembly protein TadD
MDAQVIFRKGKWGAAGLMAFLLLTILSGCKALAIDQADGSNFPYPDPEPKIEITDDARTLSLALAYFAQGHLHDLRRQPDQALAAYEKVIAYYPDAQDAYLRVALNLIRRNQADQAVATLQQLAKRQPEDAQPLIWLGATLRQLERQEEAMAVLDQALQLNPANETVYVQKADLLIQQDEDAAAAELLKEGIEAVAEPLILQRILGELQMRRALLATDEDLRAQLTREAIERLEQVIESLPDDPSLLTSLGDLYLREGQMGPALKCFEQVAELRPMDLDIRERLTYLYELNEQPEQAARVLEDMTFLQPNNPRLYLALGALQEILRQPDRAIESYRRAARAGRPEAATYLKLGIAQMESDPEQALADLREGLELIPDHPRMLEMIGYIAFHLGRYDEASAAFEEAKAKWVVEDPVRDTLTPNFHLYWSVALIFDDDYAAVPEILELAMAENDMALEAFAHFVFESAEEEQSLKAAEILESLRAEHTDQLSLLATLGLVYNFNEQYEDAVRVLDEAYAMAAEQDEDGEQLDGRFFFWYAAANERIGQYERAEELFYRCLELDPDNPEVYNYLAYMWAELGVHLEKAEKYSQRALAARPDSPAFIDTLGWIYYQQERYDEAYAEIKRAAEMLPDDPVILDHLGDIYHALGQLENAQAQWLRAFQADPENEGLRQKLADHDIAVPADEAEPVAEPEADVQAP